MPTSIESLAITVDEAVTVAARLLVPPRPGAALVLAHGAGAGMDHPFMESLAHALAAQQLATLRFQFPFMQTGSKRPDSPAVAQATVRAATIEATRRLPGVALFAGGKSFGGRMSSQAQAATPLAGVRGLVFFGFPLHPAGKPSTRRADHLSGIRVPMLFLQGTRDALAEFELIRDVVDGLGAHARFIRVDDADHAFHVRARSGRTDAAVVGELARATADWMNEVSGGC